MADSTPTARRHATPAAETRPLFWLAAPGQPRLALQVQPPTTPTPQGDNGVDVVYLHGSTFGADLSIFFRFDGRSWADALNGAGHTVWGFDWAGYGHSERYPNHAVKPVGRMADALAQLQRVMAAIRSRNGNKPVAIVAHSWGASVGASYASRNPRDVCALVLFGPIVPRGANPALVPTATPTQTPTRTIPPLEPLPSHYPVSIWAQYRRFVEDVPRGQPQVLNEAHFQAWAEAYLASDPCASTRSPPSVWTPAGPGADVRSWWSGDWLYRPARVLAPTLLVRGAWDSLCTDTDAATLLAALGSKHKLDCKIERATHLMHLEQQRGALYQRTNAFLQDAVDTMPPAFSSGA